MEQQQIQISMEKDEKSKNMFSFLLYLHFTRKKVLTASHAILKGSQRFWIDVGNEKVKDEKFYNFLLCFTSCYWVIKSYWRWCSSKLNIIKAPGILTLLDNKEKEKFIGSNCKTLQKFLVFLFSSFLELFIFQVFSSQLLKCLKKISYHIVDRYA